MRTNAKMRPELLFVSAIAISLALQGTARAEEQASQGSVTLEGSKLLYDGLITDALNERLSELYESGDPRPTALRIRSWGGEINAGMDLGEFVFERGLAVEVFGYCFSSCANYVATAASGLHLEPTAVLGWHGGATQELDPKDIAVSVKGEELEGAQRAAQLAKLNLAEMMRANVERETAFFERIGVDQRITVSGQTPLYRERYPEAEKYAGWDYAIEDLRRLGVRDVTVIGGGEWQPGELPGGYKVFRLSLDAKTAPPGE